MAENDIYNTLVRPLLTERGTILKEQFNQYLFETSLTANKTQIKSAVEALFKVKVEKVRTMVVRGKFRRFGKGGGERSDWKKAIVTLAEGQKIDFTEAAS